MKRYYNAILENLWRESDWVNDSFQPTDLFVYHNARTMITLPYSSSSPFLDTGWGYIYQHTTLLIGNLPFKCHIEKYF